MLLLDASNIRSNEGPSDFDIPHRFVLSYLQELPFGPGRRYVTSGAWSHLVGHWQVNVIMTLSSGTPYTPTIAGDPAGTLVNNQRPNLVGNPELPDPSPARWFDPAAFAVPASGTFGNAGRNSLRG